MKKGDMVESVSYSIKEMNFPPRGIVVSVNTGAIDMSWWTVDVLWNTGKLETHINPQYLRKCYEPR